MNKNKSFERKITLESSDQSDNNLRSQIKSPNSRITSLKNISFKEVPFSQHIFNEGPARRLKVSSATSFNPEGWSFQPRWDLMEAQFEDRQRQFDKSNRFLQARMSCLNRKSEKKALQKRNSVIEEVDHGLFDEVVSFRTIKKNQREAEKKEEVEPII